MIAISVPRTASVSGPIGIPEEAWQRSQVISRKSARAVSGHLRRFLACPRRDPFPPIATGQRTSLQVRLVRNSGHSPAGQVCPAPLMCEALTHPTTAVLRFSQCTASCPLMATGERKIRIRGRVRAGTDMNPDRARTPVAREGELRTLQNDGIHSLITLTCSTLIRQLHHQSAPRFVSFDRPCQAP